ncbi:hypothetical protein [Kineosporia sp. NBRC 101731]|uniref:hypothetical protein n=1 Tax=Kineosporia sp. NBRC 101731 TaxID=3032199 RepID=UPI0024A1601A|nr:hypothetical protein [Kineosporia sp. NBRC 101731]GLY27665.1 hypothetical protein Kisp02_10300 [Kineosporia sp. NBRC 101731]
MTGYNAGSASSLNTLIASGDSDGGQGAVVLVVLLVCAVVLVMVSIISKFQQPFVIVLQHPFKLLMKTVLLGVTMTVVGVAVISIILAAAGAPS